MLIFRGAYSEYNMSTCYLNLDFWLSKIRGGRQILEIYRDELRIVKDFVFGQQVEQQILDDPGTQVWKDMEGSRIFAFAKDIATNKSPRDSKTSSQIICSNFHETSTSNSTFVKNFQSKSPETS